VKTRTLSSKKASKQARIPQRKFFTAEKSKNIKETNPGQIKKALKSSPESIRDFRQLFEHMNSCVAVYTASANGKDFIIRAFNRAAEKAENVNRKNIIGKSVLKVFPGVKKLGLFKVFQQVWKTGRPQRHPVAFYKDNRISGWKENYVYKTPNGEIVAIYNDITRQKQTEYNLKESEKKFRNIIKHSQDGIIFFNKKNRIIFSNAAMAKLMGCSTKDLVGRTISSLHPPKDWTKKIKAEFQKHLNSKLLPFSSEIPVRRKDGSVFYADISSSSLTINGEKYFSAFFHDITERKQAEEALKKSEEKYRGILETMGEGYYEVDLNGNITFVNDAACRMHGYARQEIIGMSNRNITTPETAKKIHQIFEQVYKTGRRATTSEHETIRKDGSKIWIETSIDLCRDASGKKTGFKGIIRNITEQKLVQENLRQSEENFRRSLDESPLGIRIVTADGKTIYANQAILDIYGYKTIEELNKTPLKKRYTPESYADYLARKALRDQGKESPTEYEINIVRKNGKIRNLQAFRKEIVWNGKKQFQVIYNDITKQKAAEKALQQSEEKYRTILETMEEGYYEVDLAGNTTFVNDAMCNIHGYSRQEIIGKNNRDYTSPETAKKVYKEFREIYLTGKPGKTSEHQIIRKDGSKIWIEASITPRKDAAGKIIGFKGIVRDISERKKAEEALRGSEEKYRFLTEAMTDIVWMANIDDLRTTYVSPSIENLLGFTPEERKRQSIDEQLTPESLSWGLNALAEELAREKQGDVDSARTIERELEFYHKDGSTRWMDVVISGIRNEQGVLTGIHGVARDVTERKHAEEELRKKHEELEIMIESSPIMIYFKDAQNRFTRVNKALLEQTGLTKEEIEGKSNEIINPRHAAQFLQEDREIIASGKPKIGILETIKTRKGSMVLQTDKVPYRDKSGKIIGIIGFSVDITEQKKAQDALLRSEEKYRSLVENAQEGIYQTAPDGNFITVNNGFAKIYGYNSAQEVLQSITDISRQLYVNPHDRERLLKLVKEYGAVNDFEIQGYRKDGGRVWTSLSAHAVLDNQKRVLYYQGTVRDISEKKQIEAERQENLKKMRKALQATINAMAVTVETRDPYTAGHQRRVAHLAQAIATEMKLSDEQIEGIRMASLIHDIGKISIPSEILTKPTRLTTLEYNLIKTHPVSGHTILKDIEFPWPIARVVLEHHERVNGAGYPHGLKENDILLESKILAVADVVEAISTHRPYRAAYSTETALEEILKNRGILYDAEVVDVCLRLFREKHYTMVA
jgi:PAS domain S-box-containing protein